MLFSSAKKKTTMTPNLVKSITRLSHEIKLDIFNQLDVYEAMTNVELLQCADDIEEILYNVKSLKHQIHEAQQAEDNVLYLNKKQA